MSIIKTAQEQFVEFDGFEEKSPLERLRFFCSLAMDSQDWLDVEIFFTDIEKVLAVQEQANIASKTPLLGANRARLEIKRSIAPANLWHWSVVFDNGHIFVMSSESFESAEICMLDASTCGLDALHGAEMALEHNVQARGE